MNKRKYNASHEKKIIKIPKTDFPSLNSTLSTASHSAENDSKSSLAHPPLLLLQLPPSLTVQDLTRSHIVFCQDDSDQCRLISEEKGITFDLVKVSTSNSYVVLVPNDAADGDCGGCGVPEKETTADNVTQIHKEQNDDPTTSHEDSHISYIEGRLLRETDTFFIECVECKIDLRSEIEKILKDFVYPSQGISVEEISYKLLHSKKEVQKQLDEMKAFQISSGNNIQPDRFGLLSEEMERDVWFVIRSVLSEWDGGRDYAGKGVLLQDMIEEIMQRNDGNEDDLEEGVVKHCLDKCTLEVSNNGRTILDVDYIARIIAHHVFNLQQEPWKKEKFVEQWYKMMPGVGSLYEPKLDILKGIAIETTSSRVKFGGLPMTISEQGEEGGNEAVYLQYLPRDSLPCSHEGRMKALFKECTKWKLDDLIPYIEDLVDHRSQFKTVHDLLSRYAKIAPREEGDEDNVVWYVSK